MERNNKRDILQPHGPVEDTLFRPAMSSQLDIFGITSSPLPEDLEVSVLNHKNTYELRTINITIKFEINRLK